MFSGQIKGVTGWSPLLQEAELRLVKFLPDILALQKSLVKRFQNVPEVVYQTIRDFISSHTSGRTLLSQEIGLGSVAQKATAAGGWEHFRANGYSAGSAFRMRDGCCEPALLQPAARPRSRSAHPASDLRRHLEHPGGRGGAELGLCEERGTGLLV